MKKLIFLLLLSITTMNLIAQQNGIESGSLQPEPLIVLNDSLYDGHIYQYYNELFKTALRKQNTGVVLTILGIAGLVGGFAIMSDNYNKWKESEYDDTGSGMGFTMFVAGAVMFPIRLTRSLVWSAKKRNAKKAMEEFGREVQLTFQPTSNGVGFVLHL